MRIAHVLLLRRPARQGEVGEATEQQTAAHDSAAGQSGLAKEVGASVAGYGFLGLTNGAVGVDDVELDQI
ncbi:MAG: hypothetical protein WKF40_03460 [Thermoleophilaceae bacterium]